MDLTFSNFLNFYFHLGLITTPMLSMTYVCSLMFHSHHDHMAKRSHYRIMIFFDFGVYSILRTPPHPRFLPPPPQPHHPYTRHRGPRNTDRLEEGSLLDAPYGEEEDPDCTAEDCVRPRLEPAMVESVLPSKKSGQRVGQDYRESSPDQARFGRQ